ncbi:uncharacterized, partial [Tachysurus ichikawai]
SDVRPLIRTKPKPKSFRSAVPLESLEVLKKKRRGRKTTEWVSIGAETENHGIGVHRSIS